MTMYPWYYMAAMSIPILILIGLLLASWGDASRAEQALWKENRRNDLLRSALRQFEWKRSGNSATYYCPTCFRETLDGHSGDCLVGRALQPDSCAAVGEKRKAQKVGKV